MIKVKISSHENKNRKLHSFSKCTQKLTQVEERSKDHFRFLLFLLAQILALTEVQSVKDHRDMPRSISLLIDYLMIILTLIVTYQCLFALFRPQSHAMNYSDQTEAKSSCSNR